MRMANIPYKNVNNEFKHNSSKGQIPFIEINGRQIADTNAIIAELTRLFNIQLDAHLSEQKAAEAIAYHSLFEDTLRWQVWYFGSRNSAWCATDDGVGGHFAGIKKLVFKRLILPKIEKTYRKKCFEQGIGRNTPEEVLEAAKLTLRAINVIVGSKRYIMGERPSTIDATAFGHLARMYCPVAQPEVCRFMNTECRDLVAYFERMKAEYWPDWKEATTTLSLDTYPPKVETCRFYRREQAGR
jgi:glutathione S-transferase